jgi:hypothetical protein
LGGFLSGSSRLTDDGIL